MNLNKKAISELTDKITVHNLKMDNSIEEEGYVEEIMHGEIEGLTIFHKAYEGQQICPLSFKEDYATLFLILKGSGILTFENECQTLDEASIVILPNGISQASIAIAPGEILHFLELKKMYSVKDKENLHLQNNPLAELYYARFQDCKPYVEKIKSPNTVSRTVLPRNIIPRVALGTVEAKGPDKVGAHRHPMLEQLFLGLADNSITVFAEDASVKMKAFSILHIPLGSTHWVEVADKCKMNYMWMDFFLTKDGEAWLNTHKSIE